MRIKTETIVGLFMLSALTIFLFMSFKIGIWRLDVIRYAHYVTYFNDVSGLNEKSDILIAGVKIGWVQKLSLISRNQQVRVDMMIDRSSSIYSNAHALIRQNGLLGTKYIEIIPGNADYPILPPGSALLQPNKSTVQIDEILSTFKDIADNVSEVTSSLKKVLGDEKNTQNFSQLIADAQKAFQGIEKVTENTNKILSNNEENLTVMFKEFSSTATQIRERLPLAIDSIKIGFDNISDKLTVASTSFKDGIDNVSSQVNRVGDSFTKAGESFSKVGESFIKAGDSVSNTMKPIQNVVEKLEKGDGVLGSLVADDELAKEIKSTVHGLKKYFSYSDRLMLEIDTHVESMQGTGNDLDFKDAKGFFNVSIRPSDDFSYLAGLATSYAGVVKRTREDTIWYNQEKHQIIPADTNMPEWGKLWFAPVVEKYQREYSALTFNLQLAKEFGRLKCRTGIFENTFGFGLDYDIPLLGETKWISSFELFRFNEFMSQTVGGRVVFDIDMPHLKWYNRVFVNDSCYFVFGIDDFISKFNKNFFVGMGLDFEQSDVKYLTTNFKN